MQAQQAATAVTLGALLPAYTKPAFPQELLALCASLYARSRSRVASLKPDEEVARGFACCHLACERLKQKLNLPAIVARPPCGPRVYKKLYAFLDKAMPADAPSTPRKNVSRHDATPSTTGTRTSTNQTPAKTPYSQTIGTPASVSVQGTPTPSRFSLSTPTGMPERKRRRLDEGGDVLASLKKRSDAPEWLHGAAQYVSKQFQCPPAATHVYEGVCEVSKGKRLVEEEMASLVVAVLLTVLKKMGKLESIESSYTVGVREMVALKKVSLMRMGAVVTDVERWIDEEAQGWTETSWFEAVPVNGAGDVIDPALLGSTRPTILPPVPRQLDFGSHRQSPEVSRPAPKPPMRQPRADLPPEEMAAEDDFDMDVAEFEQEPESEQQVRQQAQTRRKKSRRGTTRGGLGTMIQNANDWLSDERRADFVIWKSHMMRKIEAAERRQHSSATA